MKGTLANTGLLPTGAATGDGYIVSEGLATTLATEREQFLKYEGSRALFFRDDQPLHAGDTLTLGMTEFIFEPHG